MEYQKLIDPKSNKNGAHIVYTEGRAILIDPEADWNFIRQEFVSKQLTLVYILVTAITFKKTYQIAEIKKQTGAKFLCLESDLIKLRNLPRWADEKNICGVKAPHVDGFILIGKSIELEEFETTMVVVGNENLRQYQIGKLRVPKK